MAIYRGKKAVLNGGLPEPLVESCDNGQTLIAVRGQNRPKPPLLPAIRTDIAISPKPVTIKTKVGNLFPRGLISVDPRLQKVVEDKKSNKKKTLDINYKDFKYQISNEALIYINANLENIFGNTEEKEIESAADLTEIQISQIQRMIRILSDDDIINELVNLITKPDYSDDTKTCIGDREVIPHTESLYDIISQIGEGKLYKLIGFDEHSKTFHIQLNEEYSESFGDNPPTIQVNLENTNNSKSIRQKVRDDSEYPLSASKPQEADESEVMFKSLLNYLKSIDPEALEVKDFEEYENDNEQSLEELIDYFNNNQRDSLDYQVNLEYSFNGEEFRQSYVFAEKNKPVSGDWDLLLTAYPNNISPEEKQPLNTINSEDNQELLYNRTKALFKKYKNKAKNYESHPLFDIEIDLNSLKKKNEKDKNQALNTLINMLEKFVTERKENKNINSNIIKIKELNFETITALNPYFLQNIGLTNAYSALNSMLLNLAYLAKDDTLELTSMIDPIQHGEDSLNPGHRSDFDEIYISTKDENGNPIQLYAENESDLRDILINELNHNRQTIDLHHECPLSIWAPYYDKKIATQGDGVTHYHPDPYFNEQIFINISKFLYGSDESYDMTEIIQQAQTMHEMHKSNIIKMSKELKDISNESEEFKSFMKNVVQIDNISDDFEKIDVLSDLISKLEDRIKEYCSETFGINIHPMHPYDSNLDKFIKRHSNHGVDDESLSKLEQFQGQLNILKEQEKYERNLTSNNLILNNDEKVTYDKSKIQNLIQFHKETLNRLNKNHTQDISIYEKSLNNNNKKLKKLDISLRLNKFINFFGLRKNKIGNIQNEITNTKEENEYTKKKIEALESQATKLGYALANKPYSDFIQNAINENPEAFKAITDNSENNSIRPKYAGSSTIPSTPVQMIGNPLSRALQEEELAKINTDENKPTTSSRDRKNSQTQRTSVNDKKRNRATSIYSNPNPKSNNQDRKSTFSQTLPLSETSENPGPIRPLPGLMKK